VRAASARRRTASTGEPASVGTTAGGEPAPTLPRDFYARPVVAVARDLVGCVVTHDRAAGVIVEAEAYHQDEPACHAFVGLTPRTRTLFGPPGRAYVYRSYGIHALLNAVTEDEGVGAAVLIRALEPIHGLEEMRARRGIAQVEELCSGPGKLTQALGIELHHDAGDLAEGPVRFHARPPDRERPELVVGPRVGITKAADLPWRFCARGNPHVSRPRPAGWARS
jgi:DNA-3-methyladenine glycosylase